jgi:hypothetical protein
MIQIANLWIVRKWSELKLANGNSLFRIPKENEHVFAIAWTENDQAKLKADVDGYTLQGASGAWSVHRWQLAGFHYCWETLKIATAFLHNGTTKGHSIFGRIVPFFDR